MPALRQRPKSPLSSESLGVLLYRYFFFEWLFRDVNRGSALERAEAWRFNRRIRRYLPVYLRRWTVLVVCSYAAGALLESSFSLGHAATLFYCVSCVSFAMTMLIVRAWLSLKYG